MHDDEVQVTADDVRRLLATQVPDLATAPVTPLADGGTDHRLFLLGDPDDGALLARLPRVAWAAEQAASDARWLPRLAPHLPLRVPVPVALGRAEVPEESPSCRSRRAAATRGGTRRPYPFAWSVVPRLPGRAVGDPWAGEPLGFPAEEGASTLGAFVRALRSVDAADDPRKQGTSRGVALHLLDPAVRDSLAEVDALQRLAPGDPPVDVPVATRAWERALAAPPTPEPTWIHGDLMPGNLLAHEGRLTAVIDWGAVGVGDPAVDLCPAWWLFDGEPRAAFLSEATAGLPADIAAAAIEGARGWVLVQALIAIPYYDVRWPAFAAASRRRWRHSLRRADVVTQNADRPYAETRKKRARIRKHLRALCAAPLRGVRSGLRVRFQGRFGGTPHTAGGPRGASWSHEHADPEPEPVRPLRHAGSRAEQAVLPSDRRPDARRRVRRCRRPLRLGP